MGSFNFRLIIAAIFLSISAQIVYAQNHDPDQYEYTEWHKKTGAETRLTALGSDLMGDRIDPHMGSLSFSQTDVSIPGNSGLEVAIGRTRSGGLAYRHDVEVEFGDWELSSPRIQAISIETPWSGNRCSADYDITLPDGADIDFLSNTKYSNGVMVRMGGSSQQVLENPQGDQWPAGATHVTTGNWYFTCLNNIAGGGQGFLGHAPNGDIYRFDRFFARNHYHLIGKYRGKHRFQNIIAATQVKDVHGNTVDYTYDGLNRLTRIESNDQRVITLGYDGNSQLIESVTANGRTWNYSYAASTYTEDAFIEIVRANEAHKSVLRTVELPDHGVNGTSSWEFDIDGMTASPGPGILCQQQSRTLTITHPHGTVGTFVIQELQHRQDITKRERQLECPGTYRYGDITGSQPNIFVPAAYAVMGITRKTLSGNGFDDIVWSYAYEQDRTTRPTFNISAPNNGLPAWPERTNWTKVTAPDGHIMTYTHYWAGAAADGYPGDDPDLGNKLKRLTISESDGTVLRTTDTEYDIETGIGSTFARQNPSPASVVQPGRTTKTTITQEGTTYISEQTYITENTDPDYSYGFPIETRSSSSLDSGARGSDIDYLHNTTKWILGRPETVHEVSSTGARRERSSYVYNGNGQKISQTRYEQPWASYTYYTSGDADGRIHTLTDALNRTYEAVDWVRGTPKKIIRPDNTEVEQDISVDGWIMAETDARGYETQYRRDTMGRLTRILPSNVEKNKAQTNVTNFFYGGVPKQFVDKGWERQQVIYDSLFRAIQDTRVARPKPDTLPIPNKVTTTRYDGLGRTIFKSLAYETANTQDGIAYEYDALGRVKREYSTIDLNIETKYDYLADNCTKVTTPEGDETITCKNGFGGPGSGDIISISQPEGVITTLSYNNYGELIKVEQTDSQEPQEYFYDDQRRLCRYRVPEAKDTLYKYDAAGQMTSYAKGMDDTSDACIDPSGDTKVELTYDDLGRLKTTEFAVANTPDIWRDYDANGNLIKVFRKQNGDVSGSEACLTETLGANCWFYYYDEYNRLYVEDLQIDHLSFETKYTYDGYGYLIRKVLPTGRHVPIINDHIGRTLFMGYATDRYAHTFEYHVNDQVSRFRYGNGQHYRADQNSLQQTTDVLIQKPAGGGQPIKWAVNMDYTYDLNGRVKSQIDVLNPANTRSRYDYDGLGRLKKAVSPQWGDADYTYDKMGNLLTKRFSNWKGTGLRTVTNAYSTVTNRISSSDDSANIAYGFAYDARGNVIQTGGLKFTYDMADQPIAMFPLNGTGSAPLTGTKVDGSYVYDGNLKRIKSVVTTGTGANAVTVTRYNVYDHQGRLIHVQEGNDDFESLTDYLHGAGMTIARIKDGIFTYMHPDHLGSPQAGSDENGDIAFNEYYTPFGEAMVGHAANDNQSGFTGHIKDADTGLNYMQARYYDPNAGRFLSIDPVTFLQSGNPANFNRYSYAFNDPVNIIDPDGRYGYWPGAAQQASAHANHPVTNAIRATAGVVVPGSGVAEAVAGGASVRGIAAAVVLEAPGLKQANKGQKVYRALSKSDNVTDGLKARNPAASATPAQHVNGKKDSQFISTTKSESTALNKFDGGNGVVEIDLGKVNGSVTDVSGGIPGASQKVNNFAKKDQEVLIQGTVPPEAMRVIREPNQ